MTLAPPVERERKLYYERAYPAELMHRLLGAHRGASLQYGRTEAQLPLRLPQRTALHAPAGLRQLLAATPGALALHAGPRVRTAEGALSHLTSVFDECEFVVDLDVKDLPFRQRLCACAAKDVCVRCWLVVELGFVVCRALLTEALGLGAPLVVFSGGKGCHFWWASPRACALESEARDALVDRVLAPPLATDAATAVDRDPHRRAAAAALYAEWWRRGVNERALVADPAGRVAQFFKEQAPPGFEWPPARDAAAAQAERRRSVAAWTAFERAVGREAAVRLVAEQCWPRIDGAVSRGAPHMVKTPFAIHKRTGLVALPLPDVYAFAKAERMPSAADVVADDGKGAAWLAALETMRAWLALCGR